jgi:hypothetical protein
MERRRRSKKRKVKKEPNRYAKRLRIVLFGKTCLIEKG